MPIRAYQVFLSPDKNIFKKGAPVCKFYPSCSEYAKLCFEQRHFLKAFYLSLRRILKCHPFQKGGYDPVPLGEQ